MNWNFQNTYTKLPNVYYSDTKPHDFENPRLILFNSDLANELNLNVNSNEEEICDFLLGKKNKEKKFFSQAYAGHQFGNFTILGDGRALLLGEHVYKNNRFDIQLKGSGQTPYSRNGDGKAALGPMIREYLVSEAMHHLHVSSTRALAVISTGEKIKREKFEPGAILVRVAKSHIRVGTFQFGSLLKNKNYFNNLIDYTISRLHPEIKNKSDKYLILFNKICEQQMSLILDWMRVGFIHGVMNTDNMSLSGETIDYGPCAFMDNYNPKMVYSSIDKMGRYSFENQSKIALWNLARFAETFLHLVDNNEKTSIKLIEEILEKHSKKFQESWINMMSKKLNLEITGDNKKLIKDFLDLMHIYKLDYTNTFVSLEKDILDKKIFGDWLSKYKSMISKKYDKINPRVIPRNHIIENIINKTYDNEFSELNKFNEVLKKPYENDNVGHEFTNPPQEHEKVYQTFCGT